MNWPFLPQNLVNLVPATSPTNSIEFVGPVAGTKVGPCDYILKQFTRCDWSQGLVASTHDVTSSCDLLQGLVAGTSPIVCADLKTISATSLNEAPGILLQLIRISSWRLDFARALRRVIPGGSLAQFTNRKK